MSHQLLRLARLLLLLQVLCVRPTESVQATCSLGYAVVAPSPYTLYYKESSYCQLLYYSQSVLTWVDANTACGTQSGGTLVTVDSAEINTLVFGLSPGGAQMWMGLTDMSSEGNFVWLDGTPYSYSNWNTGEPNNLYNEDCVHFLPQQNGLWNDLDCT